jgi:hypothetical protein
LHPRTHADCLNAEFILAVGSFFEKKEIQLRNSIWNKPLSSPVEINALTFNCDARKFIAFCAAQHCAQQYSGDKGEEQ